MTISLRRHKVDLKSWRSDRSSMSDLSTNPGHTPCGWGFLQREDAGGSLSTGCLAASQAAPNAITMLNSTVSISAIRKAVSSVMVSNSS